MPLILGVRAVDKHTELSKLIYDRWRNGNLASGVQGIGERTTVKKLQAKRSLSTDVKLLSTSAEVFTVLKH